MTVTLFSHKFFTLLSSWIMVQNMILYVCATFCRKKMRQMWRFSCPVAVNCKCMLHAKLSGKKTVTALSNRLTLRDWTWQTASLSMSATSPTPYRRATECSHGTCPAILITRSQKTLNPNRRKKSLLKNGNNADFINYNVHKYILCGNFNENENENENWTY